jgi:hypothetical protein
MAVNLEPDECLLERAAVKERALRAWRRLEVEKTSLQREDLS